MKNNFALVSTFAMSALLVSGVANAYTDADASGNWSGNLDFNGTITNTSPAWKYQIPDTAVQGAKNWDVERISGSVDGSNTIFSFNKDLTVLEGVMKAPTPVGGSGLQPQVTFGESGKTVVWDTSNPSLSTPVAIELTAKDGTDGTTAVGKLKFNLVGQAATQAVVLQADGSGLSARSSVFVTVPKAYALLKSQPYYASTYDETVGSWGANATAGEGMAATENLSGAKGSSWTKMSAAIVADASDFKLVTNSTAIPQSWNATLPITISVK